MGGNPRWQFDSLRVFRSITEMMRASVEGLVVILIKSAAGGQNPIVSAWPNLLLASYQSDQSASMIPFRRTRSGTFRNQTT